MSVHVPVHWKMVFQVVPLGASFSPVIVLVNNPYFLVL